FFSAIVAWGFKIDDTPLQKLLKQLAKITASYPQEKIHLQLDKPYYAVGEDIWLKAYIVTAEKNEPSLLSKVLYIDLIDEKNEVRKNLKIPIENGTADGNISLIDSLQTGNYRIRAYTNYMRNYDHDFFFEKFIKIGNVVETLSADAKKTKDKKAELSIQFFPEGGNLLSGIRNKIGIKAVTSDGLGANLSGYVINRNKEKVAEFATEHAGMGIFALMAQAKEDYSAIVTLTDGSIQSFNLPKVAESGYAISVNATEDKVNIRVFGSADQVDGKELSVIAQANGVVCASFTSKLDKSVLSASLDKKSFPTGIIQFTLFNAENKPLSERLIFVNHHDELKIDIKNKEQANTKKKTTLDLFVGDVSNNPVDGNFSISVVDAGNVQINEDDETTILSNLLLTSDLKGHIEQPNYYFNTNNPDREKHLDNLLLTQGWRRFIWADVANAKEPEVKFRPEQSLEISGKITQFEKPLSNAKVSLISTTPGLFLKLDTVSDIKGNFVFDRMDIPDSASFMLQAKTTKDSKDVKIVLNPSPQVTSKAYYGNTINIAAYVDNTKKMFQELEKFNMLDKRILLKTVEIKAKPVLKPKVNVPNSANASGAVDYVITSKMLTGAINIFSPFYKSPGVIVRNGMIYRNRPPRSLSGANPPMLLIVDGVQINQAMMPDYITSINPADVEGIEILTSDYNVSVLGSDASGGAVYITTRKGGGKNPAATNIARIKNAGFSVKKEFYKPDYDDPKTNQQLLDLRSTIYWNPNVNTDVSGKATIKFFNASSP
ncbi:MAG: hypothetical protein EOO91_16575, partial [Pedobacter sp.]